MIGSYGIAKIDIAAITDANVQFLRDTDLGLLYRSGISQSVSPVPTGKVLTATITTPGKGYSLPLNGTVLCDTTSVGGVGTGLQVEVRTDESGTMALRSSVKNTAGFDNYQNTLALNFDGDNPDPYTYGRITATGQPFSGTSLVPLAGTSKTGTAGTFNVTVSNGSVTSVTVAVAGSGYKVGDVVTITKALLETAGSFTVTGGNVFQGDLTIFLNEDNITGQIIEIVRFIGGTGYVVGEVLTLQEVGGGNTGTATVTVATLETLGLNTPGPINKYPTGIMNTGTAGAIVVKDTTGNTVVLGAMQPGVIRPFAFSQVMDAAAGTVPAVGEITILYR